LVNKNPIILIHGLWNTSSIFSSIISKLDEIGIEYFAPTLNHSYGMTSIIDLTKFLNDLIIERYGLEKEIDILGFSMGGIIGRNWIKKFNGYKRTRRFISIGSPHKGTLLSQLVPKYPFRGISEMKINSRLLRELSKYDYLLNNIECISFFTYWDLMVFPGWRANLNAGEKISLKILKHRNLVKNQLAIKKIIEKIII
tara:strand:+ start:437 stop:1030 length:594 start_codon:yes stop_codon:yes gene_type:complete